MLETGETNNDAAAGIIDFKIFVIVLDTLCPINSITR